MGVLSCSYYAETIRKAYRRIDAVSVMKISLAHEEVLIQFDPNGLWNQNGHVLSFCPYHMESRPRSQMSG